MRKVLLFATVIGFMIMISGTLSYFYDVESQRSTFKSGHWASEIYPTASFVKKGSPVKIEFYGKPYEEYNYETIFRIVDAPGIPKLNWDGDDFIQFSVRKNINDWEVGMHISPQTNGTYAGTLTISFPSYPYRVVEIPVTVMLED